MGGSIVRENGKVFIKGVNRLQWKVNRENTFMGSLEAVLAAIREPVDYSTLMGISGAAFRLHFHVVWCPSSPDAGCGFNCIDEVYQQLGYKTDGMFIDPNDTVKQAEMWKQIKTSIDKGIPLVALDMVKVPDYGVITGYQEEGRKIICQTYYNKSAEYMDAEKWPWCINFITERAADFDRKKAVKKSLKTALALAYTDIYDKNYKSGLAAYDYWISGLEKEEDFKELKTRQARMHPNAWIYYSLLDARRAAVIYLDKYKDDFELKDIGQLREYYSQLVKVLEKGSAYVKFPWELKPEEWSAEMRAKQADILKQALDIEKKAAELLKKNLGT